jgi:hypothetical protein
MEKGTEFVIFEYRNHYYAKIHAASIKIFRVLNLSLHKCSGIEEFYPTLENHKIIPSRDEFFKFVGFREHHPLLFEYDLSILVPRLIGHTLS